ncbi:MAG: ABC transporter ATP-binding protein [Proteobacteria bacterium]|nr:ABC transporter ATP-binding protein [Pseudomonadota bacterium]
MSDPLVFTDVRKQYGRRGVKALDGLSFRVPEGSICGFVGPNGAGKTTAFSVVSGYLRPDSGRLQILGHEGFEPFALKGRLQVLPQDAELGDRHTPRELVTHLAQLGGLSGADSRRAATEALDIVRLTDKRDKRIGTLSHGMRRRVAVASALAGKPDLVLLDEPTAGLDPVQAQALREALAEARGTRTLVISSHNLDELERLCDWVVMVDAGRCVREGTIAEVTGRNSRAEWSLGPGELPLEALRLAVPRHHFEQAGHILHESAGPDGDLDASSLIVARMLAESSVPIREIRRGRSLERTFMEDARGE